MAVETVTKTKKKTTTNRTKANKTTAKKTGTRAGKAAKPSKTAKTAKTKTAAKPRAKTSTGAKAASASPSTSATRTARTRRPRTPRKAASHLAVDAIMTPNPRVCRPETDLGEVGMLLWDADCGALPVIGSDREILGMITDRDVCMSLAMNGTRAPERVVAEVMSTPPVCCRPEDDVRSALAAMAENRVRRLPVVDAEGRLAGIVSMTDLVRCAGPAIPAAEVLEAQQRVARPHREPAATAARSAPE